MKISKPDIGVVPTTFVRSTLAAARVFGLVLAVAVTVVLLVSAFSAKGPASDGNGSPEQTVAPAEAVTTQQTQQGDLAEVSTVHVSTSMTGVVELLGTVKAQSLIQVFSSNAGQVAEVMIQKGQFVHKGDELFRITGPGGMRHPVLTQLDIASTSYLAAQNGLKDTQNGNAVALRSAELQLQSAKNQAEGTRYDLQIFDQNLAANQQARFLTNDSFYQTQTKNSLDLQNAWDGFQTFNSTISGMESQKTDLLRQYQDALDAAITDAERTAADAKFQAALREVNKNLDDLYNKIDTARDGITSLQVGQTLGENQFLGQLLQTETQGKVLSLTKLSTQAKLGLQDGVMDAVQAAEEGLNAAQVRNRASLDQVNAQLAIAKLNFEMAKAQADNLVVVAPVDGVVGDVNVHPGDMIAQQTPATSILDNQRFELELSVDSDTANRLQPGDQAEVFIGGRPVNVPVVNVALVADPATRLVKITLALPKISLRPNQMMKVRLPLAYNAQQEGGSGFFIPLDAVIIATEKQFVYVVQNGHAVPRDVKIGTISGDQVEILEGLSPSDEVIVDGAKNIVEGQPVTIKQS